MLLGWNKSPGLLKRAARPLKVVLVNALILFILLEVGSAAFYCWKTRSFFYTRNHTQDAYSTNLARHVADRLDEPIVYRLHPYFGYTYKPGFRPILTALAANNHGFVSNYDYPFPRRSDQYVVGIFGGSVAQYWWMYEFEHHTLSNNLRKLPALRDKEIVVLNFALPACKQPQQALILSYFLSVGQSLDLVINLDGFNEVNHSDKNNKHLVDPSMPASVVELPLQQLANNGLSAQEAEVGLAVLHDKTKLKNLLAQARECKLAFSYLLTVVQIKRYAVIYEQHLNEFNDAVLSNSRVPTPDSVVRVNRLHSPLTDEALYRDTAAIWTNSSISMNAMLAQRHIQYLHVIQANQYYATDRRVSAEEKAIAITETGSRECGESVKTGYPVLLSRSADLKSSNVSFLSALNIFDNVEKPVYIDECCHYTDLGHQVLSQWMVGEIEKVLKPTVREP